MTGRRHGEGTPPRGARRWPVLLALLVAGCGGPSRSDYLEVFRQQRAAWDEVAEVLEKIHDEKDMAAARADLDARTARFEEIARRVRELGQPPPDVLRRLEEERPLMQGALDRLREQLGRVRALPGGEAFLKQFESKTSTLGSKLP